MSGVRKQQFDVFTKRRRELSAAEKAFVFCYCFSTLMQLLSQNAANLFYSYGLANGTYLFHVEKGI